MWLMRGETQLKVWAIKENKCWRHVKMLVATKEARMKTGAEANAAFDVTVVFAEAAKNIRGLKSVTQDQN